jgi:hypothetical protein
MQKPNPWESISDASCRKTHACLLQGFQGHLRIKFVPGCLALEVAKNDAFIDWVENSDSLCIGYDATSVAYMSICEGFSHGGALC